MHRYKQIPLETLKHGLFPESLRCSPDNRHVAYVVQCGADAYAVAPMGSPKMKYTVIQDGQADGPECDGIRIDCLKYSPDGSRLAYVAVRDGLQHAVIDRVVSDGYAAIGNDSPIFSPDSRRSAYAAAPVPGESFYIIDGRQDSTFAAVTGLCFSPNSQRYAYLGARSRNETCAVVDDTFCESFDAVNQPGIVFSPNSERFAFGARRGRNHIIVVDGQAGPEFEAIGRPVFSADSEHIAYEARVGNKWRIVCDHKVADERFEAVGSTGVAFRPHSSQVVCAVLKKSLLKGSKWYPMIGDERVGKGYDGIGNGSPVFSPDGKRMACAVQTGTQWSVLADHAQGPMAEGLTEPFFSPDSMHMAYSFDNRGQHFVIHDNQKSEPFDGVGGTGFLFTPDSSRLVFDATVQGMEYLYVGADRYGPFGGFLKSSGLAIDNDGILLAIVTKGYSIERVEIDIRK